MNKRSLLIIVLLIISFQTYANMQATGWRWRNDDGNLDNATWMTANDCTPITIDTFKTLRLRIRIDNPYSSQDVSTTGLGFGEKESVYYWYETNPLSPKYSGNEDFSLSGDHECFTALGPVEYFKFIPSKYVSDGVGTQNLGITFNSKNVGDRQQAWTPGVFMASSRTFTLTHATHTEIEYCITPTANVVNGTYYFLGGSSGMLIFPGPAKLEKFPELTVNIKSIGTGGSDLYDAHVKVFATTDNIEISALPEGAVRVKLYNLMGVLVKAVNEEAAVGAINISTSGLVKGLYILNVQSAHIRVRKKVFIK